MIYETKRSHDDHNVQTARVKIESAFSRDLEQIVTEQFKRTDHYTYRKRLQREHSVSQIAKSHRERQTLLVKEDIKDHSNNLEDKDQIDGSEYSDDTITRSIKKTKQAENHEFDREYEEERK